MAPRFAHPVERELAVKPDFYLPELDVYVECTTMRLQWYCVSGCERARTARRLLTPPKPQGGNVNGARHRNSGPGGFSYRSIGGVALAALIVLFIVLNRDETKISFVVFDAQTSLWLALTVAAAGGFVAGLLIGRQRQRK